MICRLDYRLRAVSPDPSDYSPMMEAGASRTERFYLVVVNFARVRTYASRGDYAALPDRDRSLERLKHLILGVVSRELHRSTRPPRCESKANAFAELGSCAKVM